MKFRLVPIKSLDICCYQFFAIFEEIVSRLSRPSQTVNKLANYVQEVVKRWRCIMRSQSPNPALMQGEVRKFLLWFSLQKGRQDLCIVEQNQDVEHQFRLLIMLIWWQSTRNHPPKGKSSLLILSRAVTALKLYQPALCEIAVNFLTRRGLLPKTRGHLTRGCREE